MVVLRKKGEEMENAYDVWKYIERAKELIDDIEDKAIGENKQCLELINYLRGYFEAGERLFFVLHKIEGEEGKRRQE